MFPNFNNHEGVNDLPYGPYRLIGTAFTFSL